MKAANYQGCINIEYESDDIPAPEAIAHAAQYLRQTWSQL